MTDEQGLLRLHDLLQQACQQIGAKRKGGIRSVAIDTLQTWVDQFRSVSDSDAEFAKQCHRGGRQLNRRLASFIPQPVTALHILLPAAEAPPDLNGAKHQRTLVHVNPGGCRLGNTTRLLPHGFRMCCWLQRLLP